MRQAQEACIIRVFVMFMITAITCMLGSLHRPNLPLNSWTPMTANMKRRRRATTKMFPMFFTEATMHCTTCFRPAALLIALENGNMSLALISKTNIWPQRSQNSYDSQDLHHWHSTRAEGKKSQSSCQTNLRANATWLTPTTSRSRRFAPLLQKLPSCRISPFDTIFNTSSMVKIVVKK